MLYNNKVSGAHVGHKSFAHIKHALHVEVVAEVKSFFVALEKSALVHVAGEIDA